MYSQSEVVWKVLPNKLLPTEFFNEFCRYQTLKRIWMECLASLRGSWFEAWYVLQKVCKAQSSSAFDLSVSFLSEHPKAWFPCKVYKQIRFAPKHNSLHFRKLPNCIPNLQENQKNWKSMDERIDHVDWFSAAVPKHLFFRDILVESFACKKTHRLDSCSVRSSHGKIWSKAAKVSEQPLSTPNAQPPHQSR